MYEQLELPLFAPPTFDDLIRDREQSRLTVTLNSRLKRGWSVKSQAFTRHRTLTVPGYLADAPAEVKNALVDWALMPIRTTRARAALLRKAKRELESVVWRYVAQIRPEALSGRRMDPSVYDSRTRGERYDLREVFDSVNRTYFGGTLSAVVRWGDLASLTSYQSTRTDTSGQRFHMITIAGAYNHPDVPRFAIEAVMHHEMLHIAIPPARGKSRRLVHGKKFREAERTFPHYHEWELWHREKLRRLALSLKRRARKTA